MKKGLVIWIGLVEALVFAACLVIPHVYADDGSAAKEELVELEIKLPKAVFEGTPKDIKTANLDPNTGRKRRPFMAPKDLTNVALKKPVSASDDDPVIGDLELITDGDKEASEGSFVEFGPDVQWVQIDLKDIYQIYAVMVWHYHREPCVYHDVVVKLSNDPDFVTDVQTLYNNDHDNSAKLGVGRDKEYIETNEGRLVNVKGAKGRYLRLYSNGSTSNDMNHYIEVEVYGRAPGL